MQTVWCFVQVKSVRILFNPLCMFFTARSRPDMTFAVDWALKTNDLSMCKTFHLQNSVVWRVHEETAPIRERPVLARSPRSAWVRWESLIRLWRDYKPSYGPALFKAETALSLLIPNYPLKLPQ